MKKYPWLYKIYKKIINQYFNKTNHHTILIQSQINIGSSKLILEICKTILCQMPNNLNSCNICHNCELINKKNYVDLYIIKVEKKKKFIGINSILNCLNKINNTPQLGSVTIIWIPKVHLLTESSINSFLKVLEEPPVNTLFFLENRNNFLLKDTLKSRCITYNIYAPEKKNSILWLKKNVSKKYTLEDLLIALNISENSPILAKKILKNKIWNTRKKLFDKIYELIKVKNILLLYKDLKKYVLKKIYWICSLILDAIKYFYNKNIKLINTDQNKLIKIINKKNSKKNLFKIIKIWMKCFFYIKNIPKVNINFILLESLIQWEQFFNF
ncbi:DNA polymerase III subunit delta' C-terminal domain-containing protein [Buchnera aphidicola]|uniref:DNA polymerase III subunit delta' C-terminal domain-containing protein n=1 Tax=Buchnera aphidicola TaxID=9 RepID=UPI00223812A3|nr:DNA polymerase III subunit delta' C-terminal domain-containing protein [Buchnera aphidicola]MCW5197780.1 DNA polymerase III subunit delta' [Buchnera aphidicola (Chaitophorus viminalis)]